MNSNQRLPPVGGGWQQRFERLHRVISLEQVQIKRLPEKAAGAQLLDLR